jgi:hypothetical protein
MCPKEGYKSTEENGHYMELDRTKLTRERRRSNKNFTLTFDASLLTLYAGVSLLNFQFFLFRLQHDYQDKKHNFPFDPLNDHFLPRYSFSHRSYYPLYQLHISHNISKPSWCPITNFPLYIRYTISSLYRIAINTALSHTCLTTQKTSILI